MADYMETIEEQRRSFRDAFRANSSEKDKVVVSLSASALGVSIAFLPGGGANATYQWALVLAWIAFGAALVAVLLSFHFNSLQIRRCIDYIDGWKESRDGDCPRDGAYRLGKYKVTDALDALSVFCLVTGVVLIVLFVSLNL